MSREVSPTLSAYLTKVLNEELTARKRSRKYSQNQMARDIMIAGPTLVDILAGTKGIGDDVLLKVCVFLKKTRAELEAEADAEAQLLQVTTVAAAQPPSAAANLDRVRQWLYKRHKHELVDSIVAQFAPSLASMPIDILDMAEILENQIRMASGGHRKAGDEPLANPKEESPQKAASEPHPSLTPTQRESVDRQAKQLAKRSTTRGGKHAGK